MKQKKEQVNKKVSRQKLEEPIEKIMSTYVRVYSEVRRRSYLLTERYGLTMLQFTVLQIIKNSPEPMTISDVSDRIFLNQSTVSSLIDRMERDKLLVRKRVVEDRRKVFIKTTKKGENLANSVPVSPMEIFRQIFRPLTKKEQKELLRLLKKVSDPLLETIDKWEKELEVKR